jgi:hypothetical protein
MAFAWPGLSIVAGGDPPLFLYRSADTMGAMAATGYFDPLRWLLRVGAPLWIVQTTAQGALVAAAWHVVLALTPQVRISDATTGVPPVNDNGLFFGGDELFFGGDRLVWGS